MKKRLLITLSLLALGSSVTGFALASDPQPQCPEGRKPPAEAFEACEDKEQGDACTVDGPRGEMEGTCRLSPDGEPPLACAPDGPPPRR